MPVRSITLGERAQWEDALKDVTHSFYQSWEYCQALSLTKKQDIRLLKVSEGTNGILITYCQRSKSDGAFDIYSPYGFGGISTWGRELAGAYAGLQEWFAENAIVSAYLMAHPAFSAADTHLEPHRSAFVLDLTQSEEQLWQNLAHSHKYELKKLWRNPQITVTDNKQEVAAALSSLYHQTLERVGAGAAYYFSEETLNGLTLSDQALALGGKLNDQISAVVLLHYNESCAEYFINATSEEGRLLTRLLLWEGILRLKAMGVKKFNLGGGASEGDPLEEFKKRLGGTRQPICIYKQIINEKKFQELCDAHGVSQRDTAYFPAYWKS